VTECGKEKKKKWSRNLNPGLTAWVTSLTKTVEITYEIYMELFKRRLYKEYVRRKVKNAPGVNLCRNFAFASTPSSPQRNYVT